MIFRGQEGETKQTGTEGGNTADYIILSSIHYTLYSSFGWYIIIRFSSQLQTR